MRLPLTTAFVCLLLWLRRNSPLASPVSSYLRYCFFFFPSLLLLSSHSVLTETHSASSLSLSLCGFASAATTTTWRFFRSHHHHHSDPHHHVSLCLWLFLLLPPRRTPPLKAISFFAFIQFFFLFNLILYFQVSTIVV